MSTQLLSNHCDNNNVTLTELACAVELNYFTAAHPLVRHGVTKIVELL